MKTLTMTQATASLAEYARQVRDEPIVVTRAGRPIAVLTAVEREDLESLALSTNPKFLAIIERSRAQIKAGRVIPSEEVWRRLGVKPRTRRKRRSRR